jgi:hypothetical protein
VLPLFFAFHTFSAERASASPETLLIRNARQETLYVHIDYDRDPDIAPLQKPWKDMHVDSFYVTDSGTADAVAHLRYTHPFYAEMNGYKGFATDYIYYDSSPSGLAPVYTAEIAFTFPRGDTAESWMSAEGNHMNPEPRIKDDVEYLKDGRGTDFRVELDAGGKEVPATRALVHFLARRSGWIGKSNPTALARSTERSARTPRGWVVDGPGSAVLSVPASATRLRLLDALGRTAWEADALAPGSRLAVPAGLKPGAFRCVWLP